METIVPLSIFARILGCDAGEAIERAADNGWRIDKAADPTEDAARGLSESNAKAVAMEDISLLTVAVRQ